MGSHQPDSEQAIKPRKQCLDSWIGKKPWRGTKADAGNLAHALAQAVPPMANSV